jgi:hypothetical protein
LHAGKVADIVNFRTSARPLAPDSFGDTMKTGAPRLFRRSIVLAAAGILAVMLTACTASGGGQLPPQSPVFMAPASFGFTFSCEDKGGINPPTGQLRLQLTYRDHGSNPIGSSFSIQGTADTLDPVVESMLCSGQNPPPEPNPNQLIFLGRYRPTTPPPAGFPSTCPRRETSTSPLCRFEVIVQDNDGNRAASTGDFFSIKLSSAMAVTSELPDGTVFYARAGYLERGHLTVR